MLFEHFVSFILYGNEKDKGENVLGGYETFRKLGANQFYDSDDTEFSKKGNEIHCLNT